MKIDDTYFVDVDAFQYILKKKYTVKSGKKQGEEAESTVGYFGNLERALKGYLDEMIKNEVEASEDISTVIDKIDNLKDYVSELLNTELNK